MNEKIKALLRIDRRVSAHLGAVKKLILVASGFSALTDQPWAAPVLLCVREIISYYESISTIKIPLPPDSQ